MLRIVSLNLNGIRSAAKKGVFDWLAASNADVVCLQELKAQMPDLSEQMRAPDGYCGYFHCAEKKGYSGVGIYAQPEPTKISVGIKNAEFDAEGRYLRADFDNGKQKLSVIALYLPSGSSSPERQEAKFRFMDLFFPLLKKLRN